MLCIELNETGPERNSGDLYVVTECSLAVVRADFRDHLFLWKGKKHIFTVFKWLCYVPFWQYWLHSRDRELVICKQ